MNFLYKFIIISNFILYRYIMNIMNTMNTMNDVLYNDLIKSWIPIKNRPLLTRSDWWLLGVQRTERNYNVRCLMADIAIHTGTVCDRYCICMYFPKEDRIAAYLNGMRCVPLIF